MTRHTLLIFEEIFHNTNSSDTYCTPGELETITGIPVHEIRSGIEDLKEKGYIVENENGIQITGPGITEARSRWID
ncbi:MAG: hypothetical protein ACOC2H_03075 [Spirochaetota bacterium]